MSTGARITIGVVTAVAAVCFLLLAVFQAVLPGGILPCYILAGVCALISLACLTVRSRWLTAHLVWIFLLVGLALAVGDLSRLAGNLLLPAAGVGAFLLLFLAYYLFLRWKNRLVIQALRLAQGGDVDGAITSLEAHMHEHGPSADVCNALAVFQGMKQRWEESLRLVEQAEALGGPHPVYLGNKGLALWRLGRKKEALRCLRESVDRLPQNLLAVCNCGSLLVELGQRDEAWEYLEQAERLFASQGALGNAADRKARQKALDELRQKLSEEEIAP
jgi:tetratricopeptide (TPR) repeat protein